MKAMRRGVLAVYLLLFFIVAVLWLSVADLRYFPVLMFSYLYPYPRLIIASGSAWVWPVALVQALVLGSLLLSVGVAQGRSLVVNSIAGVIALLWFVAVSVMLVVSYFH